MGIPKWASSTRLALSVLFDIGDLIGLIFWLVPLGGGAAMITGIINLTTAVPPLSLCLIGFGLLAVFLAIIPRLWNTLKRRSKNEAGDSTQQSLSEKLPNGDEMGHPTIIQHPPKHLAFQISLYLNRTELRTSRGTLVEELKGMKMVWAA